MNIFFSDGDTDIILKLSQANVELGNSPDDKEIVLSVSNADYGYKGASETVIPHDHWVKFISELEDLDANLSGSAEVESEELAFKISAINRLGTLGVSGMVSIGNFTLNFEPVKFDSTGFTTIVDKFKSA